MGFSHSGQVLFLHPIDNLVSHIDSSSTRPAAYFIPLRLFSTSRD